MDQQGKRAIDVVVERAIYLLLTKHRLHLEMSSYINHH